MADWDTTAVEYATYVSEWVEEYGINFDKSISNEDMTLIDHEMLLELDRQHLVWTEHGTCEDSHYTPGLKVFGDCSILGQEASGCGCWQSYAYHIGTNPWVDENEWVITTATLPCEVCNPDGEGEGAEDCEGPEVPKGADGGECEDGFVQWYFD